MIKLHLMSSPDPKLWRRKQDNLRYLRYRWFFRRVPHIRLALNNQHYQSPRRLSCDPAHCLSLSASSSAVQSSELFTVRRMAEGARANVAVEYYLSYKYYITLKSTCIIILFRAHFL